MFHTVLPFPVVAGRTEADIRSIAERFIADPQRYLESRQRAGITLERAYWHHTPMGDFVVGYLESDLSAADAVATVAQGATEIDRFFAATIKEVHGIDLAELPDGPPPETVGEWVDPLVTERRRGMAFCAPLIAGQEERAAAWAKGTFGEPGMTASRRALGQNVEVVTFGKTPQGPIAGVYLEGMDPHAANADFARSTEPFDVEFRQELATLFPPFIDFDQPVTGVTEIFDSRTLPGQA
jgi:hypothetical protein